MCFFATQTGRNSAQCITEVLVRHFATAVHVILLVELVDVNAAVDERFQL